MGHGVAVLSTAEGNKPCLTRFRRSWRETKGVMSFHRKHFLCVFGAVALFAGECSAKTWEEVFRSAHGVPQPDYQVDYLRHLRGTFDPQGQSYTNAVFNGENEIGIVVNPSLTTNSIVVMLRTFLSDMSMAFPGQDLAITALAPGNPPQEIGTSYFFARTNEVYFQPMP